MNTVPLTSATATVGATVVWPNGHTETILDFTPAGPTVTVTLGGCKIRERQSALLVLESGGYCSIPASLQVVV